MFKASGYYPFVMKVRIINTKENPVIIKSDKKTQFVDRPYFANG